MKLNVILMNWLLLSSLMFFSACSNFDVLNGSKKPDQEVLITPTESPLVVVSGQILNKKGWKNPRSLGTTFSTAIEKERIMSVDGGKVDVSVTNFGLDRQDILYTEEFFAEPLTRLHGELALHSFREYKVNGKVYAYWIVAKQNESSTQRERNDHNEKLVYQILDSDGDGIFETLIDNNSVTPVPRWAVR